MGAPEGIDPPDDATLAPALATILDELVDDATRYPSNRDVVRRLEWLIETLTRHGHLSVTSKSLINRIRGEASVVRLSVLDDKRAVASTERDCASLMHLCRGRCCSLDVKLSATDVREGALPWDLHRPYLLAKNPAHGYCACLDEVGGCTVYADRPGTCRAYDCADDARIWRDWDRKIPAPMPSHLVAPEDWPAALAAEAARVAAKATDAVTSEAPPTPDTAP